MEGLSSIIHSRRANIYLIEFCRVMVKFDRVVYLSNEDRENLYWNIPIANTVFILLGKGTSISQAAVQKLSSAGVAFGFCGSGGSPLYAGTDIEWLLPQSEYRPTQYVQAWVKMFFDEDKRLDVAKEFQLARIDFIERTWKKDFLSKKGVDIKGISSSIEKYEKASQESLTQSELLACEAVFTKAIYAHLSSLFGMRFKRERKSQDVANQMLDHGNYIAYGLGSTCAWVLGIPASFSVLHGKTRRGGLVFDLADIIKDGIVIPLAFLCAYEKKSDAQFRSELIMSLNEVSALDYIFKVVKREIEGF